MVERSVSNEEAMGSIPIFSNSLFCLSLLIVFLALFLFAFNVSGIEGRRSRPSLPLTSSAKITD